MKCLVVILDVIRHITLQMTTTFTYNVCLYLVTLRSKLTLGVYNTQTQGWSEVVVEGSGGCASLVLMKVECFCLASNALHSLPWAAPWKY